MASSGQVLQAVGMQAAGGEAGRQLACCSSNAPKLGAEFSPGIDQNCMRVDHSARLVGGTISANRMRALSEPATARPCMKRKKTRLP